MPDTEPGTGDIMEIKTQFWSRKSSLVSEIIQIISNVLFILKFHDLFAIVKVSLTHYMGELSIRQNRSLLMCDLIFFVEV